MTTPASPGGPPEGGDVEAARGLLGGQPADVAEREWQRAVARMMVEVRRARVDPDAFIEFVLRGEGDLVHVTQAPHHRDLQAALTGHDRVLVQWPVGTGKSTQVIGRVLFEIGLDLGIRIGYFSGTSLQAEKAARMVRECIETNVRYRAVFPGVRKASWEGARWTQRVLEVERPSGSRDATLTCYGERNEASLGSRLDLVVLDDVLDTENTRTPEQRAAVLRWVTGNAVLGRLEPNTGRAWFVGTPWHQGDAMVELSKSPVWYSILRAIVEGGPIETGALLWPERWSRAAVLKKRDETPPLEFARMMLCLARDDVTSRFKREWFDRALLRGRGLVLPFRYRGPQDPMWMSTSGNLVTVAGVDLAVGKKSENDETSIVTLAIHPNGDRQLLYVESGRWSARDIYNKIIATWKRYDCQLIYVEDNAFQAYLVELLNEGSACPVEGFTTTGAKHDPVYGFEQMAIELNNGKWILPSDVATGRLPVNEEEGRLIDEVQWYSPSEHTGDRAMACYFAREAAKVVGGGAVEGPSMVR